MWNKFTTQQAHTLYQASTSIETLIKPTVDGEDNEWITKDRKFSLITSFFADVYDVLVYLDMYSNRVV